MFTSRPTPATGPAVGRRQNLHGQLDGRGYLSPMDGMEPLLLLYATELMCSVSVSFRSARAAVNVNETRYYKTIHAAFHPSLPNFTALGQWEKSQMLSK